jgi:chromosome segregation ATPase
MFSALRVTQRESTTADDTPPLDAAPVVLESNAAAAASPVPTNTEGDKQELRRQLKEMRRINDADRAQHRQALATLEQRVATLTTELEAQRTARQIAETRCAKLEQQITAKPAAAGDLTRHDVTALIEEQTASIRTRMTAIDATLVQLKSTFTVACEQLTTLLE